MKIVVMVLAGIGAVVLIGGAKDGAPVVTGADGRRLP